MRKLFCTLLLFVFLSQINAQNWQPLGPNDDNWLAQGYSGSPSIATNNSNVYVAFADNANGNKARVRTFSGGTWQDLGGPAVSASSASYTSLAFNGTTPCIAYSDAANGNKATVKMFDGANWINLGTPGLSDGKADNISLAFNNSQAYVVYSDATNAGRATVKRFDGTNWINVGSASISVGAISSASIVFSSSTPYIAYADAGNSNKGAVKKFDGLSWIDVGSIGNVSNNISLAINNSTPYVVYTSNVKTFDGANWVNVGPQFENGSVGTAYLAFDGNTPYVAFAGYASGAATLFVRSFNGAGWSDIGDLSFLGQLAYPTSFCLNGHTPYVAYANGINGSRTSVATFDGTNWQYLGTPGFSSKAAQYTSLGIDGLTPYAGYKDGDALDRGKASVKVFNGNSWVNVGMPDVSEGNVYFTSLAVNNHMPYIGFRDEAHGGRATVKMYNGAAWTDVGPAGFSEAEIAYTSLAFNGSKPYLAYWYYPNKIAKGAVSKFDGTNWVKVGPDFSDVGAGYVSLAFNDSIPYVAYREQNSGKAIVKRFDGTSWIDVSAGGLSVGESIYTSIVSDGHTPYVIYQDLGLGGKCVVKRFDGTQWTEVGAPGISEGQADYPVLAFNGKTPYLAYSDKLNGGRIQVKMFNGQNWTDVHSSDFSMGLTSYVQLAISEHHAFIVFSASQAFAKTMDLGAPIAIKAPADVNVTVDNGKCEASNVNTGVPDIISSVVGASYTGLRSDSLGLDAAYSAGTTVITWTAKDVLGNVATDTQKIVVVNNSPVINSIVGPSGSTAVNSPVTLSVNYTDNNVVKAVIRWDNFSEDVLNTPTQTFVISHTYPAAGSYKVTVTLYDACNSTTTSTFDVVITSDCSEGIITGGGWIMSLSMASAPNSNSKSKATFSFEVRNNKNVSKPTGNTEFQFPAADIKFKSKFYETFVLSGSKGQFRGTGTINGKGNYGFFVSAIDGKLNGQNKGDKFRIKIWNIDNNNQVVYDNEPGVPENEDARTVISGGSIVLHKTCNEDQPSIVLHQSQGNNKNSDILGLAVAVYPNPSNAAFSVKMETLSGQAIKITVTDITGRIVETHEGLVSYSSIQLGKNYRAGVYFLQLEQGKRKTVAKLIKQ